MEWKTIIELLERRVQELQRALEEAQRAGKRQAAPFSRRRPKAHPAKPGRKAGARYGRRCRRFANHLRREREAMFTFLYCPGLEATNYRAEQAIRPVVVTRKVWGGNRTANGAHTQSVLVSILQTCRQQLRPATGFLERLLHLRTPQALDLTPPAPR